MRLTHLAIACIAGLACTTSSASAQGVVAWQFGYDFAGADTQKPTELVETPDGGALVIQTTSTRVIAVKFSKDGDRIWDFHQPNNVGPSGSHQNGNAHGAVDSAGNVYVLAGNQPGTIFKLGAGGSLIWQHSLPQGSGSAFFYAAQVRVNSQDHVVVGGTEEKSNGPVLRLMQFTPSGTLLHDRASTTGLMRRMVIGPQDEVAVFGQSDWDSGQFIGRVATFDPDGTPRWAQDVATDGEMGPSGPQFYERTEDGAIDDQGNVFAAVNGHFLRGIPASRVRGFALAGFDRAGAQLLDLEIVGTAEAGVRQIAVDGNQGIYAAGWETDCVGAGTCDPRFSVWCASAAGIAWQRRPSRALAIPGQAAAIHATANGEAVASGFHLPGNARDGLDVAFDGGGNELWSVARQGTSALSDGVARYGVGQDRRGNLFTVGQLGESVHIRKYVAGGAVGNTICGHAPMNSAGHSALIRAGGSAATADDNVTLFVWTGTPNTYVMVLASQTRGLVPMLGGGQGTLCLGGSIGRFTGPRQLRRTSMQGLTSLQLDLPRIPEGPGFSAAAPGETWYFQAWYRDANPVPTSNLTDAVRIVLQ